MKFEKLGVNQKVPSVTSLQLFRVFIYALFIVIGGFAGSDVALATATVTTLPMISVSADSAVGVSVPLGNIVLTEGAKADIGNGTLNLNAPAGFVFDTSAAVTVTVVNAGGATLAVTGSPATPTSTNLSITTSGSGAGGPGSRATMTWAGLKVKAANGIVPASGNITKSGTATIVGNPANFGTLTKVVGAVARLAFTNAPIVVTAGSTSSWITVQRQDQFGNPVVAEATRTVTLTSDSAGLVTFVPASPLMITNGASFVRFTYVDTKHGMPTITAASTSPTAITAATQQETISPVGINTWNGNGANDAWSNGGNWISNLDPGPGASIHFSGTTRLTPSNNLSPGITYHSIYFDTGAGAFTLAGNQVSLMWTIENNSSNEQTVAMPLHLPDGQTVSLRTILGSGNLTLSGVINGAGNLVKQVYAGDVTRAILSGSNTYSGTTEILAGLLSISSIKNMGSLEPSSLGMPSVGNGTIRMGGGLNSTLIYTGTGDTTDRGIEFAGAGNIALVQNGTGPLTFTGPVTFDHDSIHRLVLDGSGYGEITSAIGNAGTFATRVYKQGAGTWALCGTNTYAGPTWVEEGLLVLCSQGSVDSTAMIRINTGATFDVSAQAVFSLGENTILSGRGVGTEIGTTAATIQGAPGGIIDAGTQPIQLNYNPAAVNGDVEHPSLLVSEGTLVLGGNNFTVDNISGSPLGVGTYRIIEQVNGNVSSAGGHTVSVNGSGVVTGAVLSLSVSGGFVNLVVSEVAYVITWPTASTITYGQSLADSLLSGGLATVPGTFAFSAPATTPDAGTANQSVTFTPDDSGLDPETFDVIVTVEKATATVLLFDLAQTYDGSPKLVSATTSPEGLVVEFTYDGSATAPAGAGSYVVTGTVNEINYEGFATGTLVIAKGIPVVTNLPTASGIYVGQSLTASLLTGGAATVPGTFSFTTPSTTPGVGTAGQSVTFTPDDADNYEAVVFDVSVTVQDIPELAITEISTVGDDVMVAWPGANSWLFSVESTSLLEPGNTWSSHVDYIDMPGVDGTMSIIESNGVDSIRFYRVWMTK